MPWTLPVRSSSSRRSAAASVPLSTAYQNEGGRSNAPIQQPFALAIPNEPFQPRQEAARLKVRGLWKGDKVAKHLWDPTQEAA